MPLGHPCSCLGPPCSLFFFLFFFLLSLAQKEKAVVLEDPVPHRTECTYIAYIVQNPLLSRPCTSACSTQHNYGRDTRAPESSSRGHWRLDRLNSFHDSASGPGPWVFVSFHRLGVCASRHPVRSADSNSTINARRALPLEPLHNITPSNLFCFFSPFIVPAKTRLSPDNGCHQPTRETRIPHTHTGTHRHKHTQASTRTRTCSCLLPRRPMPTPAPPDNQAIGTRFVPSRA